MKELQIVYISLLAHFSFRGTQVSDIGCYRCISWQSQCALIFDTATSVDDQEIDLLIHSVEKNPVLLLYSMVRYGTIQYG